MKTVTISLQVLYDTFNGELNEGTIEKSIENDTEYYDLYVNDSIVCMDGESCEILEENNDFILLKNDMGETDTIFKLTIEEFKIGAF